MINLRHRFVRIDWFICGTWVGILNELFSKNCFINFVINFSLIFVGR